MGFLVRAAIIMALALIACNSPTPPVNSPTPPALDLSAENTLVETPQYTGVIFSESKASEFRFLFDEAATEFWEPSIDDVSRAEACIRQFLESAQDDPSLDASQKANAPLILKDLHEYRRQYVGIVTDGEKRIWCNAFVTVDDHHDWQTHPVYVLDGGRDYWEIVYIPDRDECKHFSVHGEA